MDNYLVIKAYKLLNENGLSPKSGSRPIQKV